MKQPPPDPTYYATAAPAAEATSEATRVTGCGHWQDGGYCGATDNVRRYIPGPRCPQHTPAALNGRPECEPDPTLTLDGIRAAKGLTYHYRPNDTALNDQRAVASGRRRSNPQTYRDAQAAETSRRTPKGTRR